MAAAHPPPSPASSRGLMPCGAPDRGFGPGAGASRPSPRVAVIGAGVAGLCAATELVERGASVEVFDRAPTLGANAASALAGAMLAPWCELESAEAEVARLGAGAADWWDARVPGMARRGSLVVAPPRDRAELDRFARRTENFARLDGDGVAELEPDLAGRFRTGLLFRDEGNLDPRAALEALARRLEGLGARLHFDQNGGEPEGFDVVIDCRGFAAREALPELRGVRGEMLLLRTAEIALTRPVRLLHPRVPAYVVPRGDGLYMVGATMIESAATGPITARSAMELIGAAYALHPAFGEAELVETGAGIRPAFPDNMPRVVREGRRIHVNGLYRHGFLLAPAMAREATRAALEMETTNAD